MTPTDPSFRTPPQPHAATPSPPQTFSHYPAIPPPVRLRLVTTGPHPCSYLPGRLSSNRAFRADEMPPEVYRAFMDAGFRRSGTIVYQPACVGCRRCEPLRVPVATFAPSKSQRRCYRRNADLTLAVAPIAEPDAERFDLYSRYVRQWHGKVAPAGDAGEAESFDDFKSFLYESPVETIEYAYRDATGRLLAVGICDVSEGSLSSVYFYFDPDHAARGLGTFGALKEIEDAARRGIPYYYLGYRVDGCAAMAYKSTFRPYQLLRTDGTWRSSSSEPAGSED